MRYWVPNDSDNGSSTETASIDGTTDTPTETEGTVLNKPSNKKKMMHKTIS